MKQYNSYDAAAALKVDFDAGNVAIKSCEWEAGSLVLRGVRNGSRFTMKVWDEGEDSEAMRLVGRMLQRQMQEARGRGEDFGGFAT